MIQHFQEIMKVPLTGLTPYSQEQQRDVLLPCSLLNKDYHMIIDICLSDCYIKLDNAALTLFLSMEGIGGWWSPLFIEQQD